MLLDSRLWQPTVLFVGLIGNMLLGMSLKILLLLMGVSIVTLNTMDLLHPPTPVPTRCSKDSIASELPIVVTYATGMGLFVVGCLVHPDLNPAFRWSVVIEHTVQLLYIMWVIIHTYIFRLDRHCSRFMIHYITGWSLVVLGYLTIILFAIEQMRLRWRRKSVNVWFH